MGGQELLATLIWGASLLGLGLGGYGVARYGLGLWRLFRVKGQPGRDARGQPASRETGGR